MNATRAVATTTAASATPIHAAPCCRFDNEAKMRDAETTTRGTDQQQGRTMLEPAEITRQKRQLDAFGRILGDNDPTAIAEAFKLLEHFEQIIVAAIDKQRETFSWREVAAPTDYDMAGLLRWCARRRDQSAA